MTDVPDADLVEMLRAAFPVIAGTAPEEIERWAAMGTSVSMRLASLRHILTWSNARREAAVAEMKAALIEFHWMARRYCDGRMSAAPSVFNDHVRELVANGIDMRQPLFARDGCGRAFDRLTDAEALAAQEDMPKGHALMLAEWEGRTTELRQHIDTLFEQINDRDKRNKIVLVKLETSEARVKVLVDALERCVAILERLDTLPRDHFPALEQARLALAQVKGGVG
jgi:hypothetical protein